MPVMCTVILLFSILKQMPGVVKFLSATDIPGTNGFLEPPLVRFEPNPVNDYQHFTIFDLSSHCRYLLLMKWFMLVKLLGLL